MGMSHSGSWAAPGGTLRGNSGQCKQVNADLLSKPCSPTAAFMPPDPLFYLIGLPSVFLISLGRGAFGGGLAILGVPLLAFAVDPVTAAFMMAPIVSASDPFVVWAFPPKTWSKPDLKWLVPGIVAGLCVGALFVAEIHPRIVALTTSDVSRRFTARYCRQARRAPTTHTAVAHKIARGDP